MKTPVVTHVYCVIVGDVQYKVLYLLLFLFLLFYMHWKVVCVRFNLKGSFTPRCSVSLFEVLQISGMHFCLFCFIFSASDNVFDSQGYVHTAVPSITQLCDLNRRPCVLEPTVSLNAVFVKWLELIVCVLKLFKGRCLNSYMKYDQGL